MDETVSGLFEAFRNAMASVCTPVSVVTTVHDGTPHGTTVSAFTSLSLDPPMVLVSLDRTSRLLELVERTRTFGLNILAEDQSDLALRFAGKGDDKFQGVDWSAQHGAARVHGSVVWLACRATVIVDGGDHRVLLSEVAHAESTARAPLTYHQRAFGTHQPHAAAG